jgi:hypothetical protein
MTLWSAWDGFALVTSSVSGGHAISGSSFSASDSLIRRSKLLLLGIDVFRRVSDEAQCREYCFFETGFAVKSWSFLKLRIF